MLDPVSGALAVLGIGFALGHIRQASFRLLPMWFGVAAIMTGVLSPYPHVAITGLAFVVPPLTLLAGMLEARTLQEHLDRQYPDGRVMSFTNPSETTTVEVFARGSQ